MNAWMIIALAACLEEEPGEPRPQGPAPPTETAADELTDTSDAPTDSGEECNDNRMGGNDGGGGTTGPDTDYLNPDTDPGSDSGGGDSGGDSGFCDTGRY